MTELTIKDHITGHVKFVEYLNEDRNTIDHGNDNSNFTRYRAGHLYFNDADGKEIFVEVPNDSGYLVYETSTGLQFEVPISDTGEADFLQSDKGILFMRYIRKHLSK